MVCVTAPERSEWGTCVWAGMDFACLHCAAHRPVFFGRHTWEQKKLEASLPKVVLSQGKCCSKPQTPKNPLRCVGRLYEGEPC